MLTGAAAAHSRWRGAGFLRRSFPEIGGLDLLVLRQGRGGIGADDVAVVEQIAAVGDGETLLGVLLHQKDADAGFLDAGERAEQFGAQERRQPERGLVE